MAFVFGKARKQLGRGTDFGVIVAQPTILKPSEWWMTMDRPVIEVCEFNIRVESR